VDVEDQLYKNLSKLKKSSKGLGVVAHAFNPSCVGGEAYVGDFVIRDWRWEK
jgi:hypothetical protein